MSVTGYTKAGADAAFVPKTQRGAANGVATLDASGLVPDTQIPATITRDSELSAAVAAAVSGLLNGAPGALDTLKELADAIGDDANYAATVTAALALRAPLASPAFTGTPTVNGVPLATGGGVSSFVIYAPLVAAANSLTLDATGATDQTAIMDACYAAAKAAFTAGAVGARIVWPTGTFLFQPGVARNILALDPGLAGTVELCGASRVATVFKLTATGRTLVGPPNAYVPGTFQHLHLHDFTVDNNNVTGVAAGQYGVVTHFDSLGVEVDDFLIERVDTINVGVPVWTGMIRRNVNIHSNHSTQGTADTQTLIKNVTVRDCNFGRSGGGGNTGVIVAAFLNGTMADSVAVNGDVRANTFITNIVIERVRWTSGITTYAGKTTSFEGAGIQVGGDGICGTVRVRDNYLSGSTDDLIEIGSAYDAVVDGNFTEDCMSESIYIRACNGGMPNPERQRIVVSNNTIRHRVDLNAAFTTFPMGVYFHAKDYGCPAGDMVALNNKVISIAGIPDNAAAMPGYGVRVIGAFNSVKIDGVTGGVTGWAFGSASFASLRFVEVGCPTGRGSIEIKNINPVFTVTSTGTGSLNLFGCAVDTTGDYRVKVDGVHPRWRNVVKSGSGAVNTRDLEVLGTNGQTTVDAFGAGTLLTISYTAHAGALSDLAVAGGLLTSVANHTTEKRIGWYRNDTDYGAGNVGPSTDGYVTAKFTLPTTPAAGYKAGVRNRVSANGANSVHSYLAFDGTNWSMNVDTEIGGVVTNQATSVIGASAPASPFWVRSGVIGTTVTADLLTSAPGTRGTTPAASSSASYTLTGATLTAFGPAAPQGYPGLVWVPQDTGSTVDDLTRWHWSTFALTATRIGAREVITTGVTPIGVSVANPITTSARVTKNYEFDDCDFTMYAQAGGVTEFGGLSTAADKALVTQRRIGWVTRPAAASITVSASPFTYTNLDGYPEDVAVYGGTVSNITVQRQGAASGGQVQSATGWSGRIEPGDTVTVTYTAAPTMRKVPA